MTKKPIGNQTLVDAIKARFPTDMPGHTKERVAQQKAKSFVVWWLVAALAVIASLALLVYMIQTFGKDLSVVLLVAVEAVPVLTALFAANRASGEATSSFFDLLKRAVGIAKEAKS